MKKIIKEGENLVICGDYNATPEESTYKYLEELGFKENSFHLNDEDDSDKQWRPTKVSS